MRTLFEQNDVLRQTYTVTVAGGLTVESGQQMFAVMAENPVVSSFTVTSCDGRAVGVIRGESARVLAETLQCHSLTVVRLAVIGVVPVSGDAHVQIIPE